MTLRSGLKGVNAGWWRALLYKYLENIQKIGMRGLCGNWTYGQNFGLQAAGGYNCTSKIRPSLANLQSRPTTKMGWGCIADRPAWANG
jgi:hypothetical protein